MNEISEEKKQTMSSELKRNESIRKSVRIQNKRMAPQPPQQISFDDDLQQQQQQDDENSSTSTNEYRTRELNYKNDQFSLKLKSPPAVIPRKVMNFNSAVSSSKDNSKVLIRDEYSIKLSDIIRPPSNQQQTNGKAKADFFKEDDSSSILNSMKSQFDQMIFDTEHCPKKTPEDDVSHFKGPSGDDPYRIPIFKSPGKSVDESTVKPQYAMPTAKKPINNRYGEQENLLKTGISDVASGHGLAFHENENSDIEEPIEFKRGIDSRNSTGGAVPAQTAKFFTKPRIVKPVTRTTSDTKNVEAKVLMMRKMMKDRDAKIPKDDTVVLHTHQHDKPKITSGFRKEVNSETLRHTITVPSPIQQTNRRDVKVNFLYLKGKFFIIVLLHLPAGIISFFNFL